MLDLVDRYSILSENATERLNRTLSSPNGGGMGEVVVS